jgi:hypothetical protein
MRSAQTENRHALETARMDGFVVRITEEDFNRICAELCEPAAHDSGRHLRAVATPELAPRTASPGLAEKASRDITLDDGNNVLRKGVAASPRLVYLLNIKYEEVNTC